MQRISLLVTEPMGLDCRSEKDRNGRLITKARKLLVAGKSGCLYAENSANPFHKSSADLEWNSNEWFALSWVDGDVEFSASASRQTFGTPLPGKDLEAAANFPIWAGDVVRWWATPAADTVRSRLREMGKAKQ
jgi:hypothetical protein